MPRQLGEPAFADDEQLFRLLRKDWIGEDGCATEEAIDLEGTSVDRDRFSTPADSLARAAAHFAAVGAIVFGGVPGPFDAPPAKSYESVVVYKPSEGIAHSEIQFWRVGDDGPSKPKGNPIKSAIRGAFAGRIRVAGRR